MTLRIHRGNKGTEAPSNLLFFDTESLEPLKLNKGKTQQLRLRLWTAIACRLEGGNVTRRVVQRGHTAKEFWDFLHSRTDRNRPLWAVAHNLGFDWTQLDFFRELSNRRLNVGPIPSGRVNAKGTPVRDWKGRLCLESRPTFAIVMGDHGVIKFTDTGNFWPVSLEKIGASLGLPKLTMPAWDAPEEDWFVYCQRDSEVCEAAFIGLLQRWRNEDCGVFQLTGPALAYQHYIHTSPRHQGVEGFAPIVSDNEHKSIPLEREGYLGGRIEAFFLGKMEGQLYHLDVNSLYPAMMESGSFPRKRLHFVENIEPREALSLLQALGGVANVSINSRIDTFTIKIDGIQHHCCGLFNTTLCGPELYRALSLGCVEKVHSMQLYSVDRIFQGWCKKWYTMKESEKAKGEDGFSEWAFAKLMLNSLSGKFAQRAVGWRDRLELPAGPDYIQYARYDEYERRDRRFRHVARVCQELVEDGEPRHSFPAISAFITSMAREWMRTLIEGCPPRSVLYLGTDSLIVTHDAFDHLRRIGEIDATRLGALRLIAEANVCEIAGPACYRFGEKWVNSGWLGRAKPDEHGNLLADIWDSLPAIIARKGAPFIEITTHKVSKRDLRPKGVLGADGWVRPYRLSNDPMWTDSPVSGRTLEPQL